MTAYPWPGNVRELIGVVESALSNAQFESVLYSKHLPEAIRVHQARIGVTSAKKQQDSGKRPPLLPPLQQVRDAALAKIERDYLLDLMRRTDRDVPLAVKISGLSRSRLYALLKKYDIR